MKSHACLLQNHLSSLNPQSTTFLMSMESLINELSSNLISSWMHQLIQIQGSFKISRQFTFINLRVILLILKPCTHSLVGLLLTPSQDIFKVTTRYGTAPHSYDYLKQHFKARNPIFNIPRCNKDVVTDTIMSDTLAVDDVSTMVQFFV